MIERPDEEKNASHYDSIYSKETFKHYTDYLMFPVWKQVEVYLQCIINPKILEIGCGSGGLAHYLKDSKYDNYIGYDFSEEAIKLARRRVDLPFYVGDVFSGILKDADYNTVIAVEVLEHIIKDRELLSDIKPGSNVIFSVPNLKCEGHVRWFGCPFDIRKRYEGILDILKTEMFMYMTAKWFVCRGVRCGRK